MHELGHKSLLTATVRSDELLLRLFRRHFDDAVAAVLRFDSHLSAVSLPFNLRAQLRELEHPPQPRLPNGLPSFIYYYVANSGWGSDKTPPIDSLDRNFVYCTDGIGLNMGCPVRLARALDALARLPANDQVEVKEGLANPTKHLATVEELLWLNAWKSPSDVRRGGSLPGAKGKVDWALKAEGYPLYLEAKFRPSDWPRLTDQGTFHPMVGSFLSKAAHKFPNPSHDAALYIVGITAFDNLTKDIIHQIGQELEANLQVQAVVFTSFAQMTHVLALDTGVRDKVWGLLGTPSTKDYPTNYLVSAHIKQRETRVAERAKENSSCSNQVTSRVLCRGLQPRLHAPVPIADDAYRMNIIDRGSDGEPRFRAIPKEIWVKESQSSDAT